MLPRRIRAQIKAPLQRMFHWHLVHKGESVCHFFYLAFTVVEGHGIHIMFAGGAAVFILLGSALYSASETE